MDDSELDVLGPVDYLVVEFLAADANFSGDGVGAAIAGRPRTRPRPGSGAAA
jgi:hypothetical protein